MPGSRYTKRYGPILGDFALFGGGEYGAIGGIRAAGNQFTGTNVMVYLDGSIGPRPGLKDITPPPSTFDFTHPEPVGLVLIGRERALNGLGVLYAVDNDGRVWRGGDPTQDGLVQWTHFDDTIALFGSPPFDRPTADNGPYSYVSSVGEETYRIAFDAGTVAAFAGSVGGRGMAIFGEHLVVAGLASSGNTIRFSEAGNYGVWPALNFLDVGNGDAIIESLDVQRNLLIVTMRDGAIWTISGTLGVNEVVRQFTASTPRSNTLFPSRIGLTKRGLMWRRGRAAVPESFDGTQLRALSYLNNWTVGDPETSDLAVTAGPDDDDIAFFGAGGAALILHNGLWTKHELGIDDDGTTGPNGDAGIVRAVYDAENSVIVATQQNGGHVNVYRLAVALERVACEANGDAVIDAGTRAYPTGSFTLPEIRDTAGRGMSLRAVHVRFTAYDTGSGRVPQFRCAPKAHDFFQSAEADDITPMSWTGDNGSVDGTYSVAGVRHQELFAFDAGMDRSAIAITIDQLEGVKVDEIVVYGEILAERAL